MHSWTAWKQNASSTVLTVVDAKKRKTLRVVRGLSGDEGAFNSKKLTYVRKYKATNTVINRNCLSATYQHSHTQTEIHGSLKYTLNTTISRTYFFLSSSAFLPRKFQSWEPNSSSWWIWVRHCSSVTTHRHRHRVTGTINEPNGAAVHHEWLTATE